MMSYFHPFRNCMQHILICAWASYLATKRHRAVFLERLRKKVVQRETKPAKRRIPWRFSVWFSAFLSRPLTITSSSKTKTNVSNPFVTCALIYATKRDKTSSTSNRLSTHVIHRFALEQQHINFWSVYSISTILSRTLSISYTKNEAAAGVTSFFFKTFFYIFPSDFLLCIQIEMSVALGLSQCLWMCLCVITRAVCLNYLWLGYSFFSSMFFWRNWLILFSWHFFLSAKEKTNNFIKLFARSITQRRKRK